MIFQSINIPSITISPPLSHATTGSGGPRLRPLARLACLLVLTAGCVTDPATPSEKSRDASWTNRDSVYAPGVVNQEEGTIEVEATFLLPPRDYDNDYFFVFQLKGNRKKESTSVAGLALCPPSDPRSGLLWLARGDCPGGEAIERNDNFTPHRPYHFLTRWGGGKISLWIDGVKSAEADFKGPIGLLPDKIQFGSIGKISVGQVKISDIARSDEYCAAQTIAPSDDHTTIHRENADAKWIIGTSPWQKDTCKSEVFPVRNDSDYFAFAGDPVRLALVGVNFSSTPAAWTARCVVKDRKGTVTLERDFPLTIPADARYERQTIEIPTSASGYHTCVVEVRREGVKPTSYELAFAVLPAALKGHPDGKLRETLGNHHMLRNPSDVYAKLGTSWHRFWSGERAFLWYAVEPEPGKFNWDEADWAVTECERRGIKMLGVLGYPPAWASSYSPEAIEAVKKSGSIESFLHNPGRYQPRDLKEWERYVRAVVDRYKGRVQAWEVYNEVDFHPPGKHATFSGSTKDYHELLRIVHNVVTELDPQAKVLISGFNLNPVSDCQMPIDLLKMGAASDYDIFNIHGYCPYELADTTLAAAQKAKPGAPWWQTEVMFMPGGDPDPGRKSAAAVRHYLWSIDKGVERYFWHGGEAEGYYLKPLPEFSALATLWTLMRGCETYEGKVDGADKFPWIESYRFSRPDGLVLHALAIPPGEAKVVLAATTGTIHAWDVFGADARTEKSANGATTIVFTNMVYLLAKSSLTITEAERAADNLLANPGFESLEGDYAIDWANARPCEWKFPGDQPRAGTITVNKQGRSGTHSLELARSATPGELRVAQTVSLVPKKNYEFSAHVLLKKGQAATIMLRAVDAVSGKTIAEREFPVAGDKFARAAVTAAIDASSQGMTTLELALKTSDATVALDDLELRLCGK